jgi:tight adherence protein C
MLLLLILGLAALAAAVYLVGDMATVGARERQTSVRRAATYGKRRIRKRAGKDSFGERVLGPAKGRLADTALRLHPRSTVDGVANKLLLAGLSRRITPTSFLALKSAAGGGAMLLGFMLGLSVGPVGTIVFAGFFGGVAFMAPDYLLSMKARKRKEDVRAELPDALDLLAVSVEAGLGFDGAIAKLTEHMEGSLAEEFSLTLNAMRIGESRADALKKMAERVPAPELSAFVRAIIQADQLGISLGRILRVQAADTRLRRQAAAEEKAMKAPIKMLFPTVLFIFPAMFIVILGPAMMNILEVF